MSPGCLGEQLCDFLGLWVRRLSGIFGGELAVACELRLLRRGGGPLHVDVGSLTCELSLLRGGGFNTQQTSSVSAPAGGAWSAEPKARFHHPPHEAPGVPAADPASPCLQVEGFLPASSKLLLLQGAMAGANSASRMTMLVPRMSMLEDMCRSFQQRDGFAADISGGLEVRFAGGLQ